MKWMKLYRRHYGFWDQKGMICPPLIDFNLNQTLSGGSFNIFGRNVALAPLASSDLRVSIRVGTSCATSTAPLRRKKSGASSSLDAEVALTDRRTAFYSRVP